MDTQKRLEELRTILRSESISYDELHELQDLGARGLIAPDDVELLEAAGVPEHQWDHPEKVVEAEANAELIAEAFNVLHETGMTPRELVDTLRMVWVRNGRLSKSIALSNIDVVDGRIGPYEDELTERIANILGL